MSYSPRLRTALVLTGTGTAGAYHAGVLRALQEAGIRIDLVAAEGIGVLGALFVALDGAAALWEADGFWKSPQARRLYVRRRVARLGRWLAGIGRFGSGGAPPRRVRRQNRWWVSGVLLDATPAFEFGVERLRRLIGGGGGTRPLAPSALGRRYVELVLENLGQPRVRELLLLVHDLDARRDLVFGVLSDTHRSVFVQRRSGVDAAPRASEIFDLGGAMREAACDVLVGALRSPLVSLPHPITFPVDSYWRGEAHCLCQRSGSLERLIDEALRAGAEQLIVVSASPNPAGPHSLRTRRTHALGAVGELLTSIEAAALADVLQGVLAHHPHLFVIRPDHNPLGPFDFRGAYDERSDRHSTLDELLQRGYEDACRRFVDAVVAAGDEPARAPVAS